jgi:hypothetical protein
MKEATKIVVHGEQGLNPATKAFLLIHRRFHCLPRQVGNARGFFEVSLRSFANAIGE